MLYSLKTVANHAKIFCQSTSDFIPERRYFYFSIRALPVRVTVENNFVGNIQLPGFMSNSENDYCFSFYVSKQGRVLPTDIGIIVVWTDGNFPGGFGINLNF